MRLAPACSLIWIVQAVVAWQQPLAAPEALYSSRPERVTLIDLLSASEHHTTLLHLLQRARLVPTLNRIANQTFFAPSDEALNAAAANNQDPWVTALDSSEALADNIQAELRKSLLYHLLNFSLDIDSISDQPQLVETLLFPHPSAGHGKPGSPRQPATDTPDHHSLLGDQGQKLRLVSSGKVGNNKNKVHQRKVHVGVDAEGEHGYQALLDQVQHATNGLLVPLDGLLTPPPSISKLLKSHPLLRKIPDLYSEEQLQQYAAGQANLTLFAPVDSAWDTDLDDSERKYLKSGFATKDMRELWEKHVVQSVDGHIGYTDALIQSGQINTVAGTRLDVSQDEQGYVKINKSKVVQRELLAENGVVHIVENLLLPEGSLQLTPEKVLLALNCTRFISLLHASNLSDIVQQTDKPYTILAPTDDIMGADKWSSPSLPRDGSPAMTDLLRYHLVNGSWDPDKLTDGMLLDSELRTSMLKDRRQKIPVSVTVDNHGFKIKGETPTTVGFADANTLGDPVCIGNSVIYMISKVLEPPSDVLQTAMTDLSLSTFVASVYAAGLDKTFKSTPGISIFAPVNDAFSQLGLAMNYLFLPTARSELRKLLRYHAVDGVAYLNELEGARDKRYSTLEGSSVYANAENGTIALRGPNVEGFPASGQIDPSKVTGADLLTSNGVLHVVDQTMLPPTLDITIEKLMRGAKANTMIDLLESANMSWVIRGEAPPEGFFDGNVTSKKKKNKKRRKDKSGQEVELDGKSYTVLCPLDSAFSRFNLTRYLHDQPALVELARQHIIPTQGVLQSRNPFPSDGGRPLTIADDTKYDTMLSHRKGGKSTYGTVKFLRFGLDGWMVGIDGARGDARHDSARVVGYGRATPALLPSSNGTDRMLVGGGLITLDAVLEPFHPSWLVSHTPAILITMLVMVVVILISLLGWRLWKSRRDAQYHTVETDDQS